MRISQGTHVITTLRVGKREMTKAIFRQVTELRPFVPAPGMPLHFNGVIWKSRVKDQGSWWAFGTRSGSPVRARMTYDYADEYELRRVGIAGLPHVFIAA